MIKINIINKYLKIFIYNINKEFKIKINLSYLSVKNKKKHDIIWIDKNKKRICIKIYKNNIRND